MPAFHGRRRGTRSETRADLHFFPLQYQALRDRLAIFIEHLFRVNPYQESPIFRGFYYTSGTQEGRPIDQVINAMLAGFGLTSKDEGMAVAPTETKSYFIRRVFSKIIFPDRHMAGPSAAGERRRRARRVRVFATGAVVTAVLAAALFILSATNRSLIRDVRRLSDKVAVLGQSHSPELTLGHLKDMDALRKKLQKMDMRGQTMAKVMFLGTYQGEPAAEAARELYLRVLLGGVMRPASPVLANKLHRNADSLRVSFDTYYQWYKTWSILQDPGTRFSRPAVKDVTPALSEYWMPLTGGLSSERNQQEYVQLLEKQLEYGSDFPHLLVSYFVPGRDESMDMEAQSVIRRYWSADGMYPSLLASSKIPDVAVSDKVSIDLGVTGSAVVPGVFSAAGWEGPVREYLEQLEEVRTGWVMENTYNDMPASIRNGLLARYALGYAEAWLEYMRGVELAGVTDVETTRTFLERAGKENSPLLQVLREVERNTRFDKEADPSLLDVAEKYGVINEFFRNPTSSNPLRFLKGGDNSGKAPYLEYLERVNALAQAYAAIAAEGGDLRRSEAYLGFGSWIDTRIPQAPEDQVAAEMVRILRLPTAAATRTVRRAVQSDLQVKWNPVYQEYRETLAGRYPLESSDVDASLKDFEKFFGTGGTFWTFYEENLASLVSEDGQVLNQSVTLTNTFLGELRKANHIRHALFSGGRSTAGFDFSIRTRPPERDAASGITVRSMRLDVGGEAFIYNMGARNWSPVRWPGNNPEAGAVLRLDAGTTASLAAMEYDGAWGFFRLMDRTEEIVVGGSEGEVSLIWRFPADKWDVTVTYEVRGLPSRHPLKKNFLRIQFPRDITAN
ncbi:MAG: hypothetical protein KJ927_08660 [Candidatus Eisenbacteria bacterium]|nr:hypothetical protein [Candidatus Eisenbacteria bacterium]